MQEFDPSELKKLYMPSSTSHKGDNGKLLLIGGSHLFHAASLWALSIASRIVDMVFYASVPENNEIVQKTKEEFRNGIVVRRDDLESYIKEADCILIGPGMVRTEKVQSLEWETKLNVKNLQEINKIKDEGEQTYFLTKHLLEKYPEKKWVIDAGALQMMELAWLKRLRGHVILTPHIGEFERLKLKMKNEKLIMTMKKQTVEDQAALFAKEYNCVVLLKGKEDTVCSLENCVTITGGNAGMTKGGTGDVLAGLTAALVCKNDMFLSAKAASYINKKAGEKLYETMGLYFNASDLARAIPTTMRQIFKV